jgi:phage-related tail fiber protein
MQVGDGWGDLPVATAAQIELIEEYFNTQAPI